EIEIIEPTLKALRAQGIDVAGPLPADTVFVPAKASEFDCIVAMYHDQGLPALKQASFGHGVNVTLGLPIVRTSVDHGTALDLAADPARARSADPGSLVAATELAVDIARNAAPTAHASSRLAAEYPPDRLLLHVTDALRFDFTTLGGDLRVIGNLPYNISSPLLFHLAQYDAIVRDITVMLQKEVVQRMAAAPGTAEYGRLT